MPNDSELLNALIEINEMGGSSDFNKFLFFALQTCETQNEVYRLALKRWIESRN